MCQSGARVVINDLAKDFPEADAQFFVVWAPMLGTESHDDAVSQSQTFGGDDRFRFYWDEEKRLLKLLGSNMRLPGGQNREGYFGATKHKLSKQEQASILEIINDPDDQGLAWDIYLLYDKDAVWGSKPPEPSFWMHQLGEDDRTLDPARLKKVFESMTNPKHDIVFLTRDGCAGTPVMRARFEEALRKKGLPEAFRVLDVDDFEEGDVRTAYGTPTVLVDGKDLMGAPEPDAPSQPS